MTVTATGPQSLREIFWVFTLMALQGFGGVMSIAQRELVEKRRWLTPDTFLEDWAVAQVMPGPNVGNLAIIVGERYMGVAGAVAAALGLFTLPLMCLIGLATAYATAPGTAAIPGMLRAVGMVVVALISVTALRLAPALHRHPAGWRFCAGVSLATLAAILWHQWPLWAVLLVIGGASCVWTYHRLRAGGR